MLHLTSFQKLIHTSAADDWFPSESLHYASPIRCLDRHRDLGKEVDGATRALQRSVMKSHIVCYVHSPFSTCCMGPVREWLDL